MKGFVHRDNLDGTFDSICLRCFQSVLTSQINATNHNVNQVQAAHQCTYYPAGRQAEEMLQTA